MSREIKFRAHVKKTGFIHRVASMAFDKRWVTISTESTESGLRTIGINWVDIMQFTGLLDKNGVEIYEGDVMKINNNKGTFERLAVIFWENDSASFAHKEYHPRRGILIVPGVPCGVVIGNVMQHPELLNNEVMG